VAAMRDVPHAAKRIEAIRSGHDSVYC
jgi:hypothetical protein